MSSQRFLDDATRICLRSVEGWLELGSIDEAAGEIARIGEPDASHPDVLAVRWSVLAARECWDEAFEVAERHLGEVPNDERAHVNKAYALRRKTDGGVTLARVVLLRAWKDFPESVLIPYNLACYDCLIDNLEGALAFLQRAIEVGDEKAVLTMARQDPDLAPIRASLDDLT